MPINDQFASSHFQDGEIGNKTVAEPTVVPPQAGDEEIHGWLKFFLIVFVGIGSIATLVLSFVQFNGGDDVWYSIADVAFGVIYLATGIFTLVAFYKRDTDAVFLAKTFVVLCFASNLLVLWASDDGALNSKEIAQMIRSLIWCVIWFVFLCKSKQVNRLFPTNYRATKTRDWVIVAIIVLFPFVCMGYSIASEKEKITAAETAALANLPLELNQHTDGRIVLTVPDGMDCDESSTDNLKIFTLSDAETGAEVVVVSDYDTDVTKKNFNQYWRNWKSEELDDIEYTVVKDENYSTDQTTVYHKTVRTSPEINVDWEFVLVFHHASGKVGLISAYTGSDTSSPVENIINTLKFL